MKKILEDISNFINNKNRYLTLERNIHLKIKSASNVKFCQVLSHHIFLMLTTQLPKLFLENGRKISPRESCNTNQIITAP